ncbi:MAG: hypothetical protein EBY92_06160, partial [Actinobacteria bacterium]|nr:hypothetical protein [Actinomycetota bacterium]
MKRNGTVASGDDAVSRPPSGETVVLAGGVGAARMDQGRAAGPQFGDHPVDSDLAGATLDVFRTEPLPAGHPF